MMTSKQRHLRVNAIRKQGSPQLEGIGIVARELSLIAASPAIGITTELRDGDVPSVACQASTYLEAVFATEPLPDSP